MAADHFNGVEQFEADLWRIADDLRANSGLASNEYFVPPVKPPRRTRPTNIINSAQGRWW